MTIEAHHYRDEIEALKKDIVIQELVRACPVGLAADPMIVHPDGSPRFEFMGRASHHYNSSVATGESVAHSIGGPAKAILELVRERDANTSSGTSAT